MQFPLVEPGDFIRLDRPPACALRPVPINACTLRITAAAGTELAGALLRVTSIAAVINHNTFLPAESTLQPEGLLHTRGMAASGLRPLCNIPHCCLPVGVWTVSQFQCGWSSSDQLGIVALVSRYLTNKLIPSGHI